MTKRMRGNQLRERCAPFEQDRHQGDRIRASREIHVAMLPRALALPESHVADARRPAGRYGAMGVQPSVRRLSARWKIFQPSGPFRSCTASTPQCMRRVPNEKV